MQLDMMDGFGSGMMGYGSWILWVLTLIPVIIGLAVLIWYLWQGGKREKESALEILKKRYARGEISKEEFEEKKKDL
jgi:putative membrane protein